MARPPHIDPDRATAWATSAHVNILAAIMASTKWRTRDFAFHGGTSLHLSWRSPRRSEDLDFLLGRDAQGVDRVMKDVCEIVQERMLLDDPSFKVELRDLTRDAERMAAYMLGISNSGFTGKVKVKVVFWRVDRSYLNSYPTTFRTPFAQGDMISRIAHPVPVADLDTAFCDKLTAFATRPYLKWRDVFDLWWIGTQTDAPLKMAAICEQFLHNVSAYEVRGGVTPSEALRGFLQQSDDEIFERAKDDLATWLPDALWKRLYPDVVRDMVKYVRTALTAVSAYLDGVEPTDPGVLKRGPR